MSYLRRLATRGAGERAQALIRPAMMPVFPPAVGSAGAEGVQHGPPLDLEARRPSDAPTPPGEAPLHQSVARARGPAEPYPPPGQAHGTAEPDRMPMPHPPQADARASSHPPPAAPRRIAPEPPLPDPAISSPPARSARPERGTPAPPEPARHRLPGVERSVAVPAEEAEPLPGHQTAPVRSASPVPDAAQPPSSAVADDVRLEDGSRQGAPSAAKPRPVVAPLVRPPPARTESPQAEPSPARPRLAATEPVGVMRHEPAADRSTAPDRPVEVHIGTIEITAAAPPPRRQARGPVGFAGYERLRTYAWDD